MTASSKRGRHLHVLGPGQETLRHFTTQVLSAVEVQVCGNPPQLVQLGTHSPAGGHSAPPPQAAEHEATQVRESGQPKVAPVQVAQL
jgi:hypothetical protein